MSELAAAGVPVAVTCRVLKIARQPYYRWLVRPVTPAELEQAYRANALVDAHRDAPPRGGTLGIRCDSDRHRRRLAGAVPRTHQ